MAETPRLAHLMILLFLGAGFCTAIGFLVLLYGTIRKKKLPAQIGASLSACCAGGYAALLLGTGILSSNTTLPKGDWKYFCEADCHIAYSVSSVRTASVLGTESSPNQASGEYVVVKLKSWFDEKSISKFRGDAPLTPDPRHVFLISPGGRRFIPVQLKPGALVGDSAPLSQPLRPGESYLTSFAFDVPKDVRDLRLLIEDDDPLSKVLIDHENSPFHGKIYLALSSPSETRQNASR
jgi:hypothetical protein